MKKEYVKPYLALESFQLVAALAGSCNEGYAKPLNQSMDECNLEEWGEFMFGAGCDDNVLQGEDNCYQTMLEGGSITLTS